jgi:hypothetical protein
MKESITKFDLEAAFKALDDMETPVAEKGIRANKPALNEIFSRKSKFDALFEEYYDISNTDELEGAQENREAEIAKAKLARIEKIVDLDADSPDDLLASYVGKYIIQCPQCMTLFYKSPEDVEESEEDPEVVNINEVCQHCGNESGYTLIGKVGAADEEDVAAEGAEDAEATDDVGEFDLAADEGAEDLDAAEEEADEAGSDGEEFDLSAINLDDEDEAAEEDDTKEEALDTKSEGNYLLEQLNEEAGDEADMDISDAEFAELLNSAEFTKPISNKAAQAMLDNLDEAVLTSEELEESVEGEEDEELTEAGFFKNLGKLGKAAIKGTKKTADKANNAFGELADKALDKSMTREEKADWVMTHTLNPDVKRIQLDNEGKIIPNQKDQKYDTYVVIGYDGDFSDGDPITASPTYDNEDLVVGMPQPQFRRTYTEAEELAKGWSMDQKGGPAMIFLTKGKEISACKYLCQFFKGELDTRQDQLEALFQKAKQDLAGKEHITKGGGVKGGAGEPKTAQKKASELQVNDVVVRGKEYVKVTKVEDSAFTPGAKEIELTDNDGNKKTLVFQANQKVTVVISMPADESYSVPTSALSSIMESLEEVNDVSVETIITEALIKNYKNVAGFRLTECKYLDEALSIHGKVFFESGNVRDITYKFTKASADSDKVTFEGLNEKLGTDKSFVLTGKTTNTVFIAESFTQIKK